MESLNEQWSRIPGWAQVATLIALPATGYIAARFRDEYQGWLDLGPGGLPYSLKGFVTNLFVTAVFARNDTKSTELYDRPDKHAVGWKEATSDERARAGKSFLQRPLPQRLGPPSESIHYCAPQRQRNANEYFDSELKKAYFAAFDKLAEKHHDAIEVKTSVLEGRGNGMFLRPSYSLPKLISKCHSEVAHIHDSDMTAHLLLSFADAKEAIAKGWAEQHRMSGSVVVPLGYTFLYLPRNKEELEVFVSIFEAAMEYAKSNGRSS